MDLFSGGEINTRGLSYDIGVEVTRDDTIEDEDIQIEFEEYTEDVEELEEDIVIILDEDTVEVAEISVSGDLPDLSNSLDEIEETEETEEYEDYINTDTIGIENEQLDWDNSLYDGYNEGNEYTNVIIDEDYEEEVSLGDEAYEDEYGTDGQQDNSIDEEEKYSDINVSTNTVDEKARGLVRLFGRVNKRENKASIDAEKAALDAFANRGNSIVFTGCGGGGTTTLAYHIANTIVNMGYTVLLVDMDTRGRAQSYISKDNYDSMEHDGANLMAALKSSAGINAHVSIIKAGFRMLSMGIGGSVVPLSEMIVGNKLARFINLAKTNHNFVIYDIPFEDAVGCASDVTFMADNVVLAIDSSNWGVTKTMMSVCNIESEDMQDTIFSRGQIVYNRYRGIDRIMGRKIKSTVDIAKAMDDKVSELVGMDIGLYFESMHVAGIVEDKKELESGWFESKQYSDTNDGKELFSGLLKDIVMKR